MSRWLVLLIICAVVITGASGCVLVVADENVAHDIKVERDRSRLARDIARELEQEESLRYSDISVSEDDGVVTLYGDVDSIDSLQYAIDVVARHESVDAVVSRLSVEIDL